MLSLTVVTICLRNRFQYLASRVKLLFTEHNIEAILDKAKQKKQAKMSLRDNLITESSSKVYRIHGYFKM